MAAMSDSPHRVRGQYRKPLITHGTFAGFPVIFVCDRKCEKAWGTNKRPRRMLTEEEINSLGIGVTCIGHYAEDYWAYKTDLELGEAPSDPGTYEGGHAKPMPPVEFHNKWCVRECERCESYEPGDRLFVYDFDHVVPNLQPQVLAQRVPDAVRLIEEAEADVRRK